MELDWTTFGLHVFNFLILIWLLKRFLYQPVFAVISDRKAAMERVRAEAERLRAEGEALQRRYEGRLAEWEREKDKARTVLLEEHRAERTRLMDDLHRSLEQEREKAAVREGRRQQEFRRQAEEAALTQGSRFAAALLSRVARPELTAWLAELALEELRALPDGRRHAIRGHNRKGDSVQVLAAHPLGAAQQAALSAALGDMVGRPVTCTWTEDASLLAGVRISLGPWVLAANLRDELKGFSESAYAADAF
jgi:F-type H+-transporting ATPase subunit b